MALSPNEYAWMSAREIAAGVDEQRFSAEDVAKAALERNGGNKSRAASELGLSRFALQRKLDKYVEDDARSAEEDSLDGEVPKGGASSGTK